jgi:hypothetical protein
MNGRLSIQKSEEAVQLSIKEGRQPIRLNSRAGEVRRRKKRKKKGDAYALMRIATPRDEREEGGQIDCAADGDVVSGF